MISMLWCKDNKHSHIGTYEVGCDKDEIGTLCTWNQFEFSLSEVRVQLEKSLTTIVVDKQWYDYNAELCRGNDYDNFSLKEIDNY